MSPKQFSLHLTWPRLTLSTYTSGFVVVFLLIVGAVMYTADRELRQLQQDLEHQRYVAGESEFQAALQRVHEAAHRAATMLADWLETRQQLNDARFYSYWQTQRVLNSGLLPNYVDGAALYWPTGAALGTGDTDQYSNRLPQRLPEAQSGLLLYEHEDHPHLYYFEPIEEFKGDSRRQIGYAAVKIDLHTLLANDVTFKYVDPSTIAFALAMNQYTPWETAITRATYRALPSEEEQRTGALFKTSATKLLIAVSILVALWYLGTTLIFARPVKRLARHIKALEHPNHTELPAPSQAPLVQELATLERSLYAYHQRLHDSHAELDQKNHDLWNLAHRDTLTGLLNRRGFDETLARLETQNQAGVAVSFVLFDCNHFKAINDTYGHQAGDAIIRAIADCLHESVRQEDRLFRIGGDEFACLLENMSEAAVLRIAERCAIRVAGYDFGALGITEPITLSVGVAHAAGHEGIDATQLHKRADIAMYQAKRPGNPRVAVFHPRMLEQDDALLSHTASSAVYRAIHHQDNIELYYQPIVDLTDNTETYYEVLVRLRKGEEIIRPDKIFAVVEARNLAAEMDMAILSALLADLENKQIPPNAGLSINLSGTSVVTPRLLKHLTLLKPYMTQHTFILEVTETTLVRHLDNAFHNLTDLQRLGFKIALDDFGSGYSSVRYLTDMPVDIVKFDMSMVRCLLGEDKASKVVTNLAKLLRDSGYKIVAEGIEEEELRRRVLAAGFTYGQGWLFGKPHPFPALGEAAGK